MPATTVLTTSLNMFSLLLTVCLGGSLYDPASNRDLEQTKLLVDIIHEKLISENCTDPALSKVKRDVETSKDGIDLEAQTQLYRHLIDLLIICRKERLVTTANPTKEAEPTTTPATTVPTTTSTTTVPTTRSTTTVPTTRSTTTVPTTTSTTTIPTTTSTTTVPTTTIPTIAPQPEECRSAINLTESWRANNGGNSLNSESNCDTRDMIATGRPWFRFTGQAGTKLLDSCPPKRSCGTSAGLWSDAEMPSDIGIVTAFTASGSWDSCNQYPRRASVMRCSDASSDFVYRYDDSSTFCNIGFCGMM